MTTWKSFKAPDLSTASVSLKIFEDPTQGLHLVIRRLPAGMDIAPDCWRFESEIDARRQFEAVCSRVVEMGFSEEILPGFKSIHLTLCGSQAGRPLCDVARSDTDEANGVKFLHAVYAPKMVFTDARLCAGCLAVWNSCEVQS